MDHSEVKHFPKVDLTPAKIEKLSEAMRLGALLSGPAFYVFSDSDGKTCAQGAALLAIGKLNRKNACENHDVLRTTWPNVEIETWSRIARMNNDGTHTREQIADWLETQGF